MSKRRCAPTAGSDECRHRRLVAVAAAALVLISRPAYAYIDPGTFSTVFGLPAAQSDALRIALIEVAPPRRGGRRLVGPNSPCTLGKLSDAKEWFVTTPAAISLEHGKVVAAMEGKGG